MRKSHLISRQSSLFFTFFLSPIYIGKFLWEIVLIYIRSHEFFPRIWGLVGFGWLLSEMLGHTYDSSRYKRFH